MKTSGMDGPEVGTRSGSVKYPKTSFCGIALPTPVRPVLGSDAESVTSKRMTRDQPERVLGAHLDLLRPPRIAPRRFPR